MPDPTVDVLTQLAFSIYENKGVFALLVGSGISRAADIPTGWEITVDLVRRVAQARGVADQPDWAAWYQAEHGDEPNYSKLLAELAGSPAERRSILHAYIEPTAADRETGKKMPTAGHYAIADLVRDGFVRVLITTNFDRLLENALRERGVEPTVIASADALLGAQPLTHSTCYLVKLHGDYMDARILNTDDELSGYPPEYDRLLDRIFDEHGLVVAGWSGAWDHALRAAILRAPNRRYSTFWAARGKPADAAADLIAHRAARLIQISDADTFLTGLQSQVATLQRTHRQNPASIDVAVATAKRFLARPEFRIELDELVSDQAGRVLSAISAGDLGPQGNWSAEEFQRRVARYEAATEGLAKVLGVLGRWGDGSEFTLAADAISVQYEWAERERGGLVAWLGLRSYPAVLTFTAYALGLVRAERWGTLHQLLKREIYNDDRSAKPAVELLFGVAWKGGAQDLWKALPGHERRRTPLADHLCDLFRDWAASFAPLTPDLELLVERFEVLCSLAYLERHTEAQLEEAQTRTQPYVGMPIGRVAWDGSRRAKLIEWLETVDQQSALLAGGFAKGSSRFLDLYIKNLNWLAGRMDW
jgi:hypothetical protein